MIANRLGIQRRTVSDWVSSRLPRERMRRRVCCPACGGVSHRFEELPPSYVYLLGLYLGDGSIASHARGVYKLRLTLDTAYPGIIESAALAMREVLPTSRVNRWVRPYGDVEVYSYSKAWPCLLPQHGPGKKTLAKLTWRGWIDSLGQRPEAGVGQGPVAGSHRFQRGPWCLWRGLDGGLARRVSAPGGTARRRAPRSR